MTAEANSIIYGEMGETVLLVTGLAGIVTSWNALIVGAAPSMPWQRRACSPQRWPSPSPISHPKNAILLIGALSVISPFGRPALVWLVNAGGLGIVFAYAFALSFLALRKNEPELERPYQAPGAVSRVTSLLFSQWPSARSIPR